MASNDFIDTWLNTYIMNEGNIIDKKVLLCTKDEEYFCNICEKPLNGNEISIEEHFKGKKHCR